MKYYLICILILILVCGCINNQDPRYKKNYFGNQTPDQIKDAYQRYSDQNQITPTVAKIPISAKSKKISIASWYIDDLNAIKIKSFEDYYISRIKIHDIIIIQGITDEIAVRDMIKLIPNRSFSYTKINNGEIHGIVYINSELTNISYINITGLSKIPVFEMKIKNSSLNIISLNINSSSSQTALSLLEKNISNKKGNIIIAGNMNIGCGRYKSGSNFQKWKWLIPSNISTRSDGSGCSDDNMIANPQITSNFIDYKIMEDVNTIQSKHYLIYAIFSESSF